jgi:MerR family transcriptional regulator/heat shock protein HspR
LTIPQNPSISNIAQTGRKERGSWMWVEISPEEPVYIISVVAKLVGLHVQTIRLYEKKGLICPKRTAKRTRLYSLNDVKRLKLIKYLSREMGINLAGVKLILERIKDIDEAIRAIEEGDHERFAF